MVINHLHKSSFKYDTEWIDLILEAKKAGISRKEISDFIKKTNPNRKLPKSS